MTINLLPSVQETHCPRHGPTLREPFPAKFPSGVIGEQRTEAATHYNYHRVPNFACATTKPPRALMKSSADVGMEMAARPGKLEGCQLPRGQERGETVL